MVVDEALYAQLGADGGGRSRDLIMKEARKQLVTAMREGTTFYVRLLNKVTQFTGDGYIADDSLPISLFDARELAKLAPFVTRSEAAGQRALSQDSTVSQSGLWESEHAYAKVLRENDLDYDGRFMLGPSFGVVVCTQLDEASFHGALMVALPIKRFQPIHVRAPIF